MTSYWIVVPRGNSELFDLLSMAFRGWSGFTVIADRRTVEPSAARAVDGERRAMRAELGPDEFIVVERVERVESAEQAGRHESPASAGHRAAGRIPVIRSRPRGRVRRPSEPARSHAARPPASQPFTR